MFEIFILAKQGTMKNSSFAVGFRGRNQSSGLSFLHFAMIQTYTYLYSSNYSPKVTSRQKWLVATKILLLLF